MRSAPNVPLLPCPSSYARLLAEGWDSVQEAFNVNLSPAFVTLLEEAQTEARKADGRLQGLAPLEIGGVEYRMRAKGTIGFRWVLECADYLLLIAPPGTDWPLSIRYLSGALWRDKGADQMRSVALNSLGIYAQPKEADYIRLSRADYCFDFHSPAFTREHRLGSLLPRFVCHSSCKKRARIVYDEIGRKRGETATVGSKSNVQVQIYDKTLEITEVSGKDWLYALWAQNAEGEVFIDDVHRLEVRFGADFLKNRNIRRPHELAALKRELVIDALYAIRLTIRKKSDSNKRRWPTHPLWSEAIRRCGTEERPPLGKKTTGRRDALIAQSRASIAGMIRNHCALVMKGYDRQTAITELNDIIGILENDPKHAGKLEQILLRQSDVEEPQ